MRPHPARREVDNSICNRFPWWSAPFKICCTPNPIWMRPQAVSGVAVKVRNNREAWHSLFCILNSSWERHKCSKKVLSCSIVFKLETLDLCRHEKLEWIDFQAKRMSVWELVWIGAAINISTNLVFKFDKTFPSLRIWCSEHGERSWNAARIDVGNIAALNNWYAANRYPVHSTLISN